MPALVVGKERGADRLGEPVETGRGEYVVVGPRHLEVGSAPLPELLDQPGEQPGGGVVQGHRQRVGPGPLDLAVRRSGLPFVVQPGHEALLLRVEVVAALGRWEGGVGGEEADHLVGEQGSDPVADGGADVLAVSGEPSMAETIGHEGMEQTGDAVAGEVVPHHGRREAVARQRGDDDVEGILVLAPM